ncbi:MAG TPA: nitronate monooxygenase [Steroidobacteraceae bacterium]|jgi:nitronate monooxygenase|nr:nitronate monooxygenase [Steroidobacteraceae bacterium]
MNLGDLFGVRLPVIQAPMAGSQGSELAIAVSKAGGLGSLPCAMLSPEGMRSELQAIQAATDRPFNVNFFCHTPPTVDAKREAAWRELLAPYFLEYGVDPTGASGGGSRTPFSAAAADVLEQFKPQVVSFHFGLPSADLMTRVKSWGSKVLASATTVEEAVWLEKRGVDAVIAQGAEGGGHRGIFLSQDLTTQVGTFALLPQVVKAVSVPVIAAGGIADATGVAAAMSLGAAGVQLGTAYLLCPEAKTSAVHRAALKSDRASHTAMTNVFSGRPARGIMNRLMVELGPINGAAPAFPLAADALAPLRKKAESSGSGDFSPLWAGQNVSGCKEISAVELTQALIR